MITDASKSAMQDMPTGTDQLIKNPNTGTGFVYFKSGINQWLAQVQPINRFQNIHRAREILPAAKSLNFGAKHKKSMEKV